MKRVCSATLALVLMLAPAVASAGTVVQDYTAGKALEDSLAATADVLDAVKIPSDVTALYVGVIADSTTIYTTEVSFNNTDWVTAFVDTCIKGTYDEHELGVPTSNATLRVPAYGLLPGYWLRVTGDNTTAGTCYAKILLKYEK